MFYGWTDRPMRDCFEKFLVAQASRLRSVGCAQRTIRAGGDSRPTKPFMILSEPMAHERLLRKVFLCVSRTI
jgi:hypothetical protein